MQLGSSTVLLLVLHVTLVYCCHGDTTWMCDLVHASTLQYIVSLLEQH
jgi:hypothetical protein